MRTVNEILAKKGKQIWSVSPETTVFDALKLMAEKGIGALLVKDEMGNPVGVMSERDYARKVILVGKSSRDTLVNEIMSHNVIYVKPERSPEECMALMINKRIRHLPVLENNKLVGFISIGDVVKAVIDEKEFTIDQLVQYIKDTPHLSTIR
ncbi:MAG TPA: CBS domain-containing protein [Ignavibacteriaceae bacterium]|nr:CBS domain-containing protein [Ignavibacteriaceae bacterium]